MHALVEPYSGGRVSLLYPAAKKAAWPLEGKKHLVFWFKAINERPAVKAALAKVGARRWIAGRRSSVSNVAVARQAVVDAQASGDAHAAALETDRARLSAAVEAAEARAATVQNERDAVAAEGRARESELCRGGARHDRSAHEMAGARQARRWERAHRSGRAVGERHPRPDAIAPSVNADATPRLHPAGPHRRRRAGTLD